MNINEKPDWDNAPDWANWLAQDSHGAWGWYEHKPIINAGECGVWDIECATHRWTRPAGTPFSSDEYHPYWGSTLERRIVK